MKKKYLPLIFIMLLIFIFQPRISLAYSDLNGHWALEYINVLDEKNLIEGYEDGSFRPDANMTRVEFYALINNLAGYTKTYAVSFSDVKKTDWYHEEVAKGIKAGYLTPTTGKLNPNKEITRQEAMRILGYVYKLSPNLRGVEKFNDKNLIKSDNKGYIGALTSKGIISGFPDGNFYPNRVITRGEISKIIALSMEKIGMPKNDYLMDAEIKFGPRGLYQ